MNSYTLRFRLFNIPIEIQPLCWILLAFLGGAFRMESTEDILGIACFMIAGVICLLAHELGHALAGQKLCGGNPSIELGGLGGVTYNPNMSNTSRWNIFGMVLAGPAAGALPALFTIIVWGIMCKSLPSALAGTYLIVFSMFGEPPHSIVEASYPAIELLINNPKLLLIIDPFIWVGIFWSLFNLLPIFPLDGAKILSCLINNAYRTAQIGMIISLLVAGYFITSGQIFNGALVCYLAYINWQHLTAFKQNRM